MTLDQVTRGQRILIINIPDEVVRAQAIRFGIAAGVEVQCAEKLPAGPVVICKGKQEIAIGHRLAKTIEVEAA